MFLSYERASRFSGRLERAGLEFEPTQSRFNGFGVLLCGDGNWNRWKFPEQGGTVKVRHFQEWTQTRTGQQREVAHWWPHAASVWAQSVGPHRAARLVRDTSLPDTRRPSSSISASLLIHVLLHTWWYGPLRSLTELRLKIYKQSISRVITRWISTTRVPRFLHADVEEGRRHLRGSGPLLGVHRIDNEF
jgi:hypothetical protein